MRITADPGYVDIYSDLYGGTAGDVLLYIQVAFDTTPLEYPTWTDITSYVRSASTKRGRQDEFDTFSVGTAGAVVDNRDRRFEPEYPSSAYYPNVKPNRRFRVRMEYLGVTYHLFTGFVDGWPQEYVNPRDGTVNLPASDAFKALGKMATPQPFIQLDDEEAGFLDKGRLADASDIDDESSGDRMARVLDGLGWTDYELDTGQTTIPGGQAKGNTLVYLQNVTTTEDGRLFVSGDGQVTFLDRHTPFLDSRSNTSQATFGDSGAELGYYDIRLPYSEDQIRNHVLIRLPNDAGDTGAEISVEDEDSIEEYLRNTYQRDVLFTDRTDAQNLGEYILDRYKDPLLRIEAIVIKPLSDPTNLIPQVLGREIGDRITVKRRPQGGAAITQEALIEGVSHSFTPNGEWTTTWNLSPADTKNYLILNDAAFGLLNSALLGY